MKLIKIIRSQGEYIDGLFKCEHCGEVVQRTRWESEDFYSKILPNMKCTECGKQ